MSEDYKSRAPRYRVRGLKVVYDTGEGFWAGPVVDSSATGLFIETTHELPEGAAITLMPDGPADEELPFEIQGVVVRLHELDLDNHWDRTPGLAIRFEGMNEDQVAGFRAYLDRHGEEVGGRTL